MNAPSQHPRYTIFFIVLFFIAILYLSNGFGPEHHSPSFGGSPNNRPPPNALYVEDQIKVNEMHYREHLHSRKGLITKYGPTKDKVQSFPSHGQSYTLWDFFIPAFQCPHRVQRVGTLGDGGKWVCGLERIVRKEKCVIYSFGLNGESSFEADLLTAAPGCRVFGYDPNVNSFGPEIENTRLKSRCDFRPFALGAKDAHSNTDHPKTYTLNALMTQNGHSFIDILKIEVEGAEFTALENFIADYAAVASLPFGQLHLEIHARDSEYAQFPKFLEWWEKLEAAGLRPFSKELSSIHVNNGLTSAEYSFINTRGNHELVSDNFIV